MMILFAVRLSVDVKREVTGGWVITVHSDVSRKLNDGQVEVTHDKRGFEENRGNKLKIAENYLARWPN